MLRAFLFILILFFAAMPVYAGVIINEVAWMGTSVSWQDEWIELYSDSAQSLDGWSLVTVDGDTNIKLKNSISAGNYYLIERTNDDTVPGITADLVFSFGSGGFGNGGEILILKDSSGNEIDRVDGSSGWAIGGNNDTKETLQKIVSGWTTALGTPKASNGDEASPPQPTPTATPTPEPSILPTTEPTSTPTPTPTQSQSVPQTPEQTTTPSPTSLPDSTATAPSPTPTSQPTVITTPTGAQSSPLYVQSAANTNHESGIDQKKTKSKKSAAAPQKDSNNEIASVASPISNNQSQFFGEYLWLIIGLGTGIIFGAVFLFAKRYFP